ncbi:MAG: ribonuclease Z [Candidatus Pacearchaeota archaeon]
MIELVFLGTGSAVPTLKRNHPAIFLRYKEENILFDCGEGTQRQFRKAKINPCRLTKLFITHWHGDHVLGIPGLLQTLAFNGYSRELEIFGPIGTKKFMNKIMNTFLLRKAIRFKITEGRKEDNNLVDNDDLLISGHLVNHRVPCFSYVFLRKSKLKIDKNKLSKLKIINSPLLRRLKEGKDVIIDGAKIKSNEITYTDNSFKITIITDTEFSERLINFASNSDILICESTYLDDLDLANEYSHLTVEQAAIIAKNSNSKKLFLVHLSQKYEKREDDFLREARRIFKKVKVAEDMEKIVI